MALQWTYILIMVQMWKLHFAQEMISAMLSLVLVCMLPMAMNEATEMGQKHLRLIQAYNWLIKKRIGLEPCLHIFMMMINIWEAGNFLWKMDGRTGCSRFLIPYGTVLAVTGNIHGAEYVRQQAKRSCRGKYRILLDREENGGYLSLEEYLPSVLAAQISPDSEMEALKAQAVIARTYIRRQMGEEKEISELSLDLDRKPREEL